MCGISELRLRAVSQAMHGGYVTGEVFTIALLLFKAWGQINGMGNGLPFSFINVLKKVHITGGVL